MNPFLIDCLKVAGAVVAYLAVMVIVAKCIGFNSDQPRRRK